MKHASSASLLLRFEVYLLHLPIGTKSTCYSILTNSAQQLALMLCHASGGAAFTSAIEPCAAFRLLSPSMEELEKDNQDSGDT